MDFVEAFYATNTLQPFALCHLPSHPIALQCIDTNRAFLLYSLHNLLALFTLVFKGISFYSGTRIYGLYPNSFKEEYTFYTISLTYLYS